MAAVRYRLGLGAALLSMAVPASAGCGGHGTPGATSSVTPSSPSSATSTQGFARPDTPPDPQTLLHAGAAALAQVPGSTLVFIESETDDAGTWKIRVAAPDGTGQELKVGADGITVLVGPTPVNDSDTDKARRHADVQAARLDYRAAVDKALVAVPNGSITELNLADSNGATVWQAVVWDTEIVEHQVTIDAVSGAVTANKQL